MGKIEIYTRPDCGYCTHARHLLRSKGLPFSVGGYEDLLGLQGQGCLPGDLLPPSKIIIKPLAKTQLGFNSKVHNLMK